MKSVCCEIIKKCSLSCLHCSARSHFYTSKHIPFDDLKNIIKQASDNQVKTFFISGGEPLLYPNIDKVIEYITSYKMQPILYSSGILSEQDVLQPIPNELFSSLEKSGLTSIAFSIYSLDSTIHDKITGTPNSLKILKRTIENARKTLKQTTIELSFLPLSDTWKEITSIIEFCSINNIYKLNILKLINQGRAQESGIYARNLSQQDEIEFLEELRRACLLTSTTIEVSKLYDCDNYEHLQISPHTSGINEYFISYKQDILKGRRFRY
jgi:MoaA/NifB/PqqE/SkfB family radical SAM enzyme